MANDREWARRWPSFRPEEILSVEQLAQYRQRSVYTFSFRALDKLQAFRDSLGVALHVNASGMSRRGARSIKEVIDINKTVRGSTPYAYSFHLWCAFDVSSPQLSPLEIQKKALAFNSTFGKWGGIGLYDTWVHLDDRDTLEPHVALWDYRTRR